MMGKPAGGRTSDGYVSLYIDSVAYPAHRLAWLCVNGYLPENDIDHINRKKADNRIENLREVSRSCNLRNKGVRADNVSGICGISWFADRNKWHATVRVNNKLKHICCHKDFAEAVAHRLAAEQCLGLESCDSCSSAYDFMQDYFKRIKPSA